MKLILKSTTVNFRPRARPMINPSNYNGRNGTRRRIVVSKLLHQSKDQRNNLRSNGGNRQIGQKCHVLDVGRRDFVPALRNSQLICNGVEICSAVVVAL